MLLFEVFQPQKNNTDIKLDSLKWQQNSGSVTLWVRSLGHRNSLYLSP